MTGRFQVAGGVFRRFARHLKPYWRGLALANLGLAGTVLMTLLEPWPVKVIFDLLLYHKPVPPQAAFLAKLAPGAALAVCCGMVIATASLAALCGYINRFFVAKVGQSVVSDIREDVFRHLHTVSTLELGSRRTGDIVLRLTADVKSLRELLVTHGQKFALHVATFSSTLAVMLWMDWRLALAAVSIAPALYFLSRSFTRRMKASARRRWSQESEVASMVQEAVASMALTQSFSAEDRETGRFRKQNRESLRASLDNIRLGRAFSQTVKVVNACGVALVLGLGAWRVWIGQLTPGDVIVFLAYLKSLNAPAESLADLAGEVTEALASAERVLDLLEAEEGVKDSPDAIAAPTLRGAVEFDRVSFGYREGVAVVRELSCSVEPGQKVALVGKSGAGKSTLLKLMLRMFDPWSGAIRMDGQDIRRFTVKSVRDQIGFLPQEPIILRRSVAENIAFGREHASMEEIVAAARAARAHEFIMALPCGYETVLDERGGNLSGGQRQRLAIARALLRDAPILILDEPSTGLDAGVEREVIEALDRLTAGKTTFVIAHHDTPIRSADLVFSLEEGRLVRRAARHALLPATA